MEIISQCYCCGSSDFKSFLETKDNYSQEKFSITQCSICGFVFTNPRPDMNEIGKYYNMEGYLSHTSHKKGVVESVYRIARNYMKNKKLNLIQNITGKQNGFSILDYGCGTGDFLGFMKKHSLIAEGVEQDALARKVANEINKVETYALEDVKNIGEEKYDVITLWHVLEHIHDLHRQIDYFNQWLKPNGKLFIAVPNIKSADAEKYGKNWDALDVPRHIYHFSPETIKQIVNQHNFSFLCQHPLLLDAYYVSMRSEWHKGTNKIIAYFKAIIAGYQSNLSAKTSGNYSSLIYVFEKK